MAFDYEEMRRIYRLEKATSRLVDVPEDFLFQVHELIDKERKAYLDSLTDMNTAKARDFANLKKLVEELFLIREKKLLNAVLVSTRLQEADDQHMAKEEKELFHLMFGSLSLHRSLMQKVLDANGEFVSMKTVSVAPAIKIEQRVEQKMEMRRPQVEEKEVVPSITLKPGVNPVVSTHSDSVSAMNQNANSGTATTTIQLQRVKILSEIPSFVGTDMKEYGPYKPEQVVELPQKIAQLFISRKLGETA